MAKTSANIRMYRLNELGDCFLITFTSGTSKSRLLVDCGSFRNSGASIKRLEQVTDHIAEDLHGKPLDVVVGTHQHNDHVSGFVHCEDAFRKIGIRQVWLSWLDDPIDPKALDIGADHNNLLLQLSDARNALHGALKGKTANRPMAARSLEVLDDVLGFYGANAAGTPPELPAEAIRILKEIGAEKPKFLEPGCTLDMPGLPAGTVRVHVLGPPRNDELLFRKDPRKGESYDHALASHVQLAKSFLAATEKHAGATASDEEEYPFTKSCKLQPTVESSPALQLIGRRYRMRSEAWRTIKDDWMQQAETLALYLDTYTNNSSLALAIELVESGKVLLFAADAQTGNWLSWRDVPWDRQDIRTDDLLARTVFYKVGHHASHNATLVEAFEKMGHPDLVAFIPVHKEDPNIKKKNGWKMPATKLFERLVARADHRVIQMDGVNPASCDPDQDPARAAWKKAGTTPNVTALWVEIDIVG